jgi:hypothetical protein
MDDGPAEKSLLEMDDQYCAEDDHFVVLASRNYPGGKAECQLLDGGDNEGHGGD